MKRLLVVAGSMLALSGFASAADDTSSVESGWGGFYVGIVGGYGWGEASLDGNSYIAGTSTELEAVSASFDVDGGLAGGQIGYDFDLSSNLVLGIVGDVSWSGVSGEVCVETSGSGCDGSPDDSFVNVDLNWLGTVRARGGFTNGNILVYVTGGVAMGDVETSVTHVEGHSDPTRSDSNTHMGWTVGGGAEFKVTETVSVGAEYLYVDLGSEDYEFSSPNQSGADVAGEGDITMSVIRASLNYRF